MRTRALNSMNNYEIEQYLKRNDVIFVPVGNAEMHGPLPIDCEYVVAEAWARLFAESCDAVYMPNLIYLCAGGTENGRGTVQMSPRDSSAYMYAIARSLLRQGFRRQVYIPSHGPSTLFMHPIIHQLMYDTKIPMLMLEPTHLFAAKGLMPARPARTADAEPFRWHVKVLSDDEGMGSNAQMLGAYKICGRLDDIPTGAEANVPEVLIEDGMLGNHFFPDHDIINQCSAAHCPAPFFYKKWNDHGSAPLPNTREEIEREAEIGEKWMRDMVSKVDLREHLDVLRRLDGYMQNEVMPAVGDHLPENRWSW